MSRLEDYFLDYVDAMHEVRAPGLGGRLVITNLFRIVLVLLGRLMDLA